MILYEAAAKALKEQGIQKLPDLYILKAEYKQLAEQKDQLQRQYNDAKTPDAGVWHHKAECGRHPADNTGKRADAGTVNLHKILFGFLNPKRLDRVAFPPEIM